jgi:hypothetical protein
MKPPNATEIRGFDLVYPASGEVLEIRRFAQDGRSRTPPTGRVVVLTPRLTDHDDADPSMRDRRELPNEQRS